MGISSAGREERRRKKMDFEEKVKKTAYELYVKNGRREGRDLLDWLAAEQIVRFEERLFAGMGGERAGLLEYRPHSEVRPAPSAQMKSKTRFRNAPRNRHPETARRGLNP
jgi:hypothetical protein